MSEVIARPATGATNAPALPNAVPHSQHHDVQPEPIDAFDVLERIGDIGIHWWSIIDSVLEVHQFHDRVYPEPVEPLPAWAVERLKDQGRHSTAEKEFSNQRRLLKDWLHIGAGNGSQYRYEAWTSRGHRLAFKHLSLEDAATVVAKLKPQYPDAFVARVHVRDHLSMSDDPTLLDTMLGKIFHVGTFMPDSTEEEYTVCDETGRNVTVPASVLRQHPIYERLDKRGKESLDFYLETYKPRQERIRAAAKGEQQ